MPTKRSIIVALVGLNLFLLAALVLSSYELPAAYAQRVGAGNNYIAVTCEADEYYDVLFILDLGNRRLNAFVPTRRLDGTVQYIGSQDLERDFRRGQD